MRALLRPIRMVSGRRLTAVAVTVAMGLLAPAVGRSPAAATPADQTGGNSQASRAEPRAPPATCARLDDPVRQRRRRRRGDRRGARVPDQPPAAEPPDRARPARGARSGQAGPGQPPHRRGTPCGRPRGRGVGPRAVRPDLLPSAVPHRPGRHHRPGQPRVLGVVQAGLPRACSTWCRTPTRSS